MATGVQEEIHYCSPGTTSGKQKRARSTNQSQFRSENTPATIEADQILLALQKLATNSNSANFKNNINRILKLPKSLTTKIPTFDGKSEKFKLFEDLFRTNLISTINLQKKTKKTTSTLSCVVMRYKHSRTSLAPTERTLEKIRETSVNGNSKTQISATGFQSSETEVN